MVSNSGCFIKRGPLFVHNYISRRDISHCSLPFFHWLIIGTVLLLLSVPPRFGDKGDEKALKELDRDSLESEVILNNTVHLNCPANANPPPQITWYKNGDEMKYDDYTDKDGRIQILNDGKILMISNSSLGDTARYTCIARNPVGENEMNHDLKVQGMHTCGNNNFNGD